jgi:hypothetical protein
LFNLSLELRKNAFASAMVFISFAATAYGQGFGTIVGTVTDSSGAVVPAATVRIIQTGTQLARSVATNAQGYFVVPSLQPSQYDVVISAPGFRSSYQKNITLQADQSLTINASLEIGASSEIITVSGEPHQVDTTTGALSQVVDAQRMIDMPLNGRNAATLTLLVAGTATTPANGVDQGSTKTFPAGVTISTNGARQSQISWNLDGGNNADIQTNINQPFPSPDALQEFSVQTSNYSARYGTNAGGVVNVVTKSGTNQFHGSAFEFVRNSVFNARNYFASSVDRLKRNQFGGTVGGPIKRDKTFFFASYQGTILHNTSSNSATLATIANLNGDFSALLDPNSPNNPSPGKVTNVIDPSTGKPFPGNKILIGRFDAAALAVEKLLPQVGGNGQIRYVQPDAQTFNEFLGRVDHSFSSRDRLTGRYFYDKFSEDAQFNPSNLLVYADSSNIRSQNGLLGETHVFSPRLLNEAHLSYSRVASARMSPPGSPSMNDLGVKEYDAGLNSIQNIQVMNFFTIGSDPPSHFTRNSYRLNNDVSWIRGRHSFYFGGSVQRDLYDVRNQTNMPGDFRFNSTVTKFAPAAFLLGQLNQLTQGSGQYFSNRNVFFGVYFQDDFHVSRRLTLNLGLRYEPFSPWQSQDGKVMEFNPVAYHNGTVSAVFTNAPKGLLFQGDPGVPHAGYTGDYNNVDPRFGFAYDVFGDGKTSLRGGAGLFYDTHFAGINGQNWGSTTPFSTSLVLTTPAGPFSDPYRGITNPFPAPNPAPSNYVFPTPTAAYGFDPGRPFVISTIYNWNLTVERQLANSWLLRTAYVGSHGSHLPEYIQENPAVYIPGSKLSTDQRRNFQPFGLIGFFEQDVNSSYNALQLSLEKRLSRGLTILANYTFAKSLDDQPYNQAVVQMNVNLPDLSTIPWNMPGRHQMDYGPSQFDRTHRFVASYVWDLPGSAQTNRWARLMIGGWQWSGIATAQTGDPLTIMAGADQSQTGLNADRAVQVGPGYGGNACGSTVPCVNYLNPTAFQLPASGTFGTVRKGSLRGPGYFNWDMGLRKIFPLPGERMQLQFRAEYFNVFNRANFSDPKVSVAAAGFGEIVSAQDPRIGQLSLKLTF